MKLRETCKYNLFLFSLTLPTERNTASNLDPTSPSARHIYKKGLMTGTVANANRRRNPAVTLTGLLSKQQQQAKWTADQQRKWLATWDGISAFHLRLVGQSTCFVAIRAGLLWLEHMFLCLPFFFFSAPRETVPSLTRALLKPQIVKNHSPRSR